MAETHPYISGAGNIVQIVNHLRKAFPASLTADTIKKLGIAPNNESYVLNILRFIGVIDADGKKTSEASKIFSQHQDDKFSDKFSTLVKKSYKDLFDVHGDDSWDLDKDGLITFFRSSDDTSATIGGRQAGTFRALAGLSGHGDVPTPKPKGAQQGSNQSKKKTKKTKKKTGGKNIIPPNLGEEEPSRNIGLTVRVEINLPADGDQDTYYRIFKSIRENLIEI